MSSEERVPVVDESNNIVAVLPRREVRSKNLRHRATFIFVFVGSEHEQDKTRQRLIVQKRTDLKDYCPGHWDACTGGVIQEGEEYHESAVRELEEELGIPEAALFHMFDFLYADESTKTGQVERCIKSDEDWTRLTSLVAAVEIMTIADILDRAGKGEPFTPDSTFAIRKYCGLV